MSHYSLKTFFTSMVSGLILCAFCGSVFATCTTEEVNKADARWAEAINSHEVVEVVNLYGPQAVLLATSDNKPITTKEGLTTYFTKFFTTYKDVRVIYTGDKRIQVMADGATSSGFYTFSGIKDGKPIEVPARYTFVYRATPTGCELIKHHSSQLPM